MKIIKDSKYIKSLQKILRFILNNHPKNAKKFEKKLDKVINNLSTFPYKYRKSYYYHDEDIRDLIFKGFTIPYLIDEENSKIIVLDIFKWQDK
jgi:plasmid stabilization system protein ParE